MAAVSLTVTEVRRLPGGGFAVTTVNSRGLSESQEYHSRRQARDELQRILDDEAVQTLMRAWVVARGLRTTADGDTADDLDALVGKSITFNVRAPNNLVRIV